MKSIRLILGLLLFVSLLSFTETKKSETEKEGIASYYGDSWNGKTTANMEVFDSTKYTCASPYIPFGKILKVTNVENNKSVTVKVNDRGPFKMDKQGRAIFPLQPHKTRILDLSKASFASISNLEKGLIKVKYKILK